MTTRNRFILGFAAGAVIGTAAALLVAPKTGKETRHIVANGAGRFARPFAGQVSQKAGQYWESLRQKITKTEGNGNGQHLAERQLEVEG